MHTPPLYFHGYIPTENLPSNVTGPKDLRSITKIPQGRGHWNGGQLQAQCQPGGRERRERAQASVGDGDEDGARVVEFLASLAPKMRFSVRTAGLQADSRI